MGELVTPILSKEELLKRVKGVLRDVYGERLKGVVLYGSEARGDAEEDSDIDMLILLDGPIKLWNDIRTIVHALYPLQMEILRPLHAMPTDAAAYERGEIALYLNAKREGIAA